MNLEKLEVVDPAIDAAIKEELGRQRNKIELERLKFQLNDK